MQHHHQQASILLNILQVFSNDSILNGFGLLDLSSWEAAVKSTPLSLDWGYMIWSELAPLKFSDSAPESPTTSMSLSLSIPSTPLWLRYSLFRATRSTAIPFALSFLAWRSRAFWSFFLRLALSLARSSCGGIGSPEQD